MAQVLALSVLAGLFALLGVLFLWQPDWGGDIFGIRAAGREAQIYVRVVAIRDLALAAFIAGLTLACPR